MVLTLPGSWPWLWMGWIQGTLFLIHLAMDDSCNKSKVLRIFHAESLHTALVSSPNYIPWIRFMLLSASMSETSLVKVAGTVHSCFSYDTIQTQSAFSGTLGVDRRQIKTFFKDPARLNVFQQIRTVDRISSRLQNTCHLRSLRTTLHSTISATLTRPVVFWLSLHCPDRKSRCSAGLQILSGE